MDSVVKRILVRNLVCKSIKIFVPVPDSGGLLFGSASLEFENVDCFCHLECLIPAVGQRFLYLRCSSTTDQAVLNPNSPKTAL